MLLIILIMGHLLSDFFFQPSVLAEKKKEKISRLFLHGIIYFVVYAVLCFIFLIPTYAIVTILILSVTHLVIDFSRVKIERKIIKKSLFFTSFIADQMLHIGLIIAVYYLFDLSVHKSNIYLSLEGKPVFNKYILIMFLLMTLLNPTAVFIKKMFSAAFKSDSDVEDTNQNIGAWIGNLERIITSVLILNNQYAAIGLVLTAKSIARFRQLEEKDFAEKYLVGTLTSLSISLMFTVIVKEFI